CLRHSFIGMLDRSGATLKEAMQLARHSDPKLTMAVYGRAQLHDLGTAVARLPSLSATQSTSGALRLTGTDTAPGCTGLAPTSDTGGDALRLTEAQLGEREEKTSGPNALTLQRVEADCDSVRLSEANSPTRTRTWNKPVNSRLLYH